MFGLNLGNCLSALGTVGPPLESFSSCPLICSLSLNLLYPIDSGGPYGALSTSFGQLQTEHPQSGISLNWGYLDSVYNYSATPYDIGYEA